MRRASFWVFAAATAVMLSGCGPQGNDGAAAGTSGQSGPGASGTASGGGVKVGIVFDTGGLGDKSFNDSAWRGVQQAEKELGATVMKVESSKESDYAQNLQKMADEGAGLVIGVGITMRTAIEQAATNSPKTKFVSIDGEPLPGLENVRTIQFKEEEGSFLVGYVAGLVSKTGKCGFVGGMELPLIKKFQYGYMAGFKTAKKDGETLPAKYVGDWVNQDKAKVAAELLFGQGADVVYHAAGKAGLGVIAAAKDKNAYAIGVDSDQDDVEPGRVLTSMIKHVDLGVFEAVRDFKDGKFSGGAKVYDLKAGGVGTSEFKNTKAVIGDENLKKLEEIKTKIASGEIKVPNDDASYNAFLATLK